MRSPLSVTEIRSNFAETRRASTRHSSCRHHFLKLRALQAFLHEILQFEVVSEVYRDDRDSYKLNLRLPRSHRDRALLVSRSTPAPSYPEACGLGTSPSRLLILHRPLRTCVRKTSWSRISEPTNTRERNSRSLPIRTDCRWSCTSCEGDYWEMTNLGSLAIVSNDASNKHLNRVQVVPLTERYGSALSQRSSRGASRQKAQSDGGPTDHRQQGPIGKSPRQIVSRQISRAWSKRSGSS